MNLISASLLVFVCYIGLYNCDEFILEKADLSIDDGDGTTLEAFKSVVGNDSDPLGIRWACLGRPKLIKNAHDESYFNFTSNGFFAYLDASITNEHRDRFSEKAREKYSSPAIKASQMVDIHVSNLTCRLQSFDSGIDLNISSTQVRPGIKWPFKLYFPAPLNSQEANLIKNKATNLGSIFFKCELELDGQADALWRFTLALSPNKHYISFPDKLFNANQMLTLTNQKLKNENKKLKEAIESFTGSIYEGVRLYGHYKKTHEESAKDCFAVCLLDAECAAITIDNGGHCFLYRSNEFKYTYEEEWTSIGKLRIAAENEKLKNENCCRMALRASEVGSSSDSKNKKLKEAIESFTGFVYEGVRLYDHYKMAHGDSANDCFAICLLDAECAAITIDDGEYCFFYRANEFKYAYEEEWTSIGKFRITLQNERVEDTIPEVSTTENPDPNIVEAPHYDIDTTSNKTT